MSPNKPKAVILRGLQGSGKSTYARQLVAKYAPQLTYKEVVFSTDRYFYKNGQYQFDLAKLDEYHQNNLNDFIAALESGQPLVICDNTNMQLWEIERYVKPAKRAGYDVDVITVGKIDCSDFQKTCAERNSHQVQLEVIQATAKNYQEYKFECL